MSVTPFMHPAFGALLGNEQVADLLSAEKEMGFMLAFERELAAAQAELDIIPAKAAEEIARVTESFEPDWQALASKTAQDGVVVPELVRQLREELSAENRNFLHFGATSQDVMDTALVLQFQSVFNQFDADLAGLLGRLTDLQNRFGDQKMMAQTRMQRALPISVGQKLATWTAPLFTLKEELFDLEKKVCKLQFGGPVGSLEKFADKASLLAQMLAEKLSLHPSDACWHTNRLSLSSFANWLSQISIANGKIGQDIALMAQNERGEISFKASGGSSAMPHKQNPVQAEILVSLSRYNAALLSALHQGALHENERSGAGWTLEWLSLPQMIMSTAASLRIGQELLANVAEIKPMTS